MLRCPGVGNCQVLKSRGWGIYSILAKKIQIPGVLPGGGMVTAGIDPCIIESAVSSNNDSSYKGKYRYHSDVNNVDYLLLKTLDDIQKYTNIN